MADRSYQQLAQLYGVHLEQVGRFGRRMGVDRSHPQTTFDGLSQQQHQQLLSLCRSSSASYREIGRTFGLTGPRVSDYARRAGIIRRLVTWGSPVIRALSFRP